MGFRQHREHQHQVHGRHRHRQQQWQGHIHPRQQPPQGRPEDETEPEGHADQPEGLGPLLRRADVGQHGAGGGGGASAHPIDQPGAEQQRQGPGAAHRPGQGQGEGKAAQAQHGAGHAAGDHRLAPEAVAEGTDQGGEQELGQGVAARQQAQCAPVAGETRQQKGQQGKDDAFPEAVVQQRQEDAEPRGRARPAHGGDPQQCRYLPMGGRTIRSPHPPVHLG